MANSNKSNESWFKVHRQGYSHVGDAIGAKVSITRQQTFNRGDDL